MSELKELKDGLIDQLKDLYSAENQLLKALPKMAKKATNENLKEAFTSHLSETEDQVQRLEKIAEIIGEKLSGKTCLAMKGLIEEGKEILQEESENDALIDALLIAAAQRVEHYEMAAYGTVCAFAKELGETKIVKLLEETLQEEKEADKKLTTISVNEVLKEANSSSEMEDLDEPSTKSGRRQDPTSKRPGTATRLFGLFSCLMLSGYFSSTAVSETNADRVDNENKAMEYNADNTGKNTRDRNDTRITADDQKLAGTDLEVLARIRREIMSNDNLSISAQNVKIIVENGNVVLRGPVASIGEKTWIQNATSRVATRYTIVNELEVAPS
ncbi:MAG: DUF892 family protein [bacterium]|nr:DUF892 family protein [bacterium]